MTNTVGDINFLGAAGGTTVAKDLAYLRRTTSQSLTASVWTATLFDAEDIDAANGHSTTTNTSRYTAVAAGKYRITGAVSFTWASGTADFGVGFRKNGSGTGIVGLVSGSTNILYTQPAAAGYIVAPTVYVALAVGDWVEQIVYCSGTTPSAAANTQMGVEWVGV